MCMQSPSNKPRATPPPITAYLVRKPPRAVKKDEPENWALGLVVVFAAFGVFFGFLCLIGFVSNPSMVDVKKDREDAAVHTVIKIASAMRAYSLDHHGDYPDGKTSTEVFQKLIDGKYVTDPEIFYLKMPGKTKAISGVLTSDNVSFDVTSGVTVESPDQLPVVFCTGYAVTYFPGDSAMRNIGRSTPFPGTSTDYSGRQDTNSGVAVAFKGHDSRFLRADQYGVIHFFTPSTFDPKGRIYTQLEP
jgi:hypothetical protein